LGISDIVKVAQTGDLQSQSGLNRAQDLKF
jgi:hypothetical protein